MRELFPGCLCTNIESCGLGIREGDMISRVGVSGQKRRASELKGAVPPFENMEPRFHQQATPLIQR